MDTIADMSFFSDCYQWMDGLWDDLSAQTEDYDDFVNWSHATIICEHIDKLQPKLQEWLSTKQCTVAKLVTNRPVPSQRTRQYQANLLKVRKRALPTIAEDEEVAAEQELLPKLTRLAGRRNLDSWIRKSVRAYGRYITSDAVDYTIKPRMKQIRQFFWSYSPTVAPQSGMGSATILPGLRPHGPTRAGLQSLSEEFGVIVTVTTKMAKYRQLLDECEVDTSFRPRVTEVLASLQNHVDNQFREFRLVDLNRMDREIQDHLTLRADGGVFFPFTSRA